jgi:hypothetical protein
MATPAELSVERAYRAYTVLAEAETFADGRAAWEDFLTHWRQGLNRCDAEGSRIRRGAYVSSKALVRESPALAYLWAATNAEEHGVAEIATVQESAFAIGAFGDYDEEEAEPGPMASRPSGTRR